MIVEIICKTVISYNYVVKYICLSIKVSIWVSCFMFDVDCSHAWFM